MYIQINEGTKFIVGVTDKECEGFFEVKEPEDFDRSEFYDYKYVDGQFIKGRSRMTVQDELYKAMGYLMETDYITAKLSDELSTCTTLEEIQAAITAHNTEYADVIAKREQSRKDVNRLKAELEAMTN